MVEPCTRAHVEDICGRGRVCSLGIMLPGAGFYRGSEEEFLRSNVLFRLGGAGVVLSSRLVDCLCHDSPRLAFGVVITCSTCLILPLCCPPAW